MEIAIKVILSLLLLSTLIFSPGLSTREIALIALGLIVGTIIPNLISA
jgi:hypothetical protein